MNKIMRRLSNIFYWLGIKENPIIKELEVILEKLVKEERENNYILNYVTIANEIVEVFEKYNYDDYDIIYKENPPKLKYDTVYKEDNPKLKPVYLECFKSFIPKYCIHSFIYEELVKMIKYLK